MKDEIRKNGFKEYLKNDDNDHRKKDSDEKEIRKTDRRMSE